MPWFPSSNDIAPQALHQSWALTADFYTHPDSLRWEQHYLFSRHWQLSSNVETLSQAGDHVVCTIAGVPLLLVRSSDDRIRAFHNVCRHRAGPLALCHGRGARALHCRYHGWTYTLEGQLRSAPEMQTAEDFDLSSIRLPEQSVDTWQGLVFAAINPAMTLTELFEEINQRLQSRDLSNYRFHRRVSYQVECNWKVYVDNYLEGYHLPHVHPGLNRLLDYRSYQTEMGRWHSLQWSPMESSDNFYGEGEALYYFLFPNTMLNVLPGRMQTNQVVPLGIDRCRVDFDYYYPMTSAVVGSTGSQPQWPDDELDRMEKDLDFSDEIQEEDIAICQQVQKNLASGSYTCGRLNPKREAGVYHFHELIRAAYREAAADDALAR